MSNDKIKPQLYNDLHSNKSLKIQVSKIVKKQLILLI